MEGAIDRLCARDERAGEDARTAVESLIGWEEDNPEALFSRRRLQVFLWYELPTKWIIPAAERLAVAEALALFFDELGPRADGLAGVCRGRETERLVRGRAEGFIDAMEESGLEPPDTPVLEWSGYMSLEEALERDAVGDMLEEEIDAGRLMPGAKGWKEVQIEAVERHLMTPEAGATSPLARIHAGRREAWLFGIEDRDERALLEAAVPLGGEPPSVAEAEAAIEPLLWVLDQLAGGLKLTQTGAFPRALVRAAVERYPAWWPIRLDALPNREMDVRVLEELHWIISGLKLARPRRGVLDLTPRGRALRADPPELLAEVALGIALVGASRELDLDLAQLVVDADPTIALAAWHLLVPFGGATGSPWEGTTQLTPAGRTLARAILHARAHGPRHTFD